MRQKIKYFITELLISILVILGLAAIGILVLFLRGIPAQAAELNTYKAVLASASEADYEALEQVIYNESAVADCDFLVNVAVAETVINRVISEDNWGDTIYEVCHKKNQFVCKPIPAGVSEHTRENISDAIEHVLHEGRTVLPSDEYVYFATKKQSYAKEHVWIGAMKNGKPKKGKGMWFGRSK